MPDEEEVSRREGKWMLARLGSQHRLDARQVIGQAQDQMAADPDGSPPDRVAREAAG